MLKDFTHVWKCVKCKDVGQHKVGVEKRKEFWPDPPRSSDPYRLPEPLHCKWKRKSINESITSPLDLCLSCRTVTCNTASLQVCLTSAVNLVSQRGARTDETQTVSSSFHAATTLHSSPPGSGRTDAHCFLYLAISQGRRTWLGMWTQDRGFPQTCFTSVSSYQLFLM